MHRASWRLAACISGLQSKGVHGLASELGNPCRQEVAQAGVSAFLSTLSSLRLAQLSSCCRFFFSSGTALTMPSVQGVCLWVWSRRSGTSCSLAQATALPSTRTLWVEPVEHNEGVRRDKRNATRSENPCPRLETSGLFRYLMLIPGQFFVSPLSLGQPFRIIFALSQARLEKRCAPSLVRMGYLTGCIVQYVQATEDCSIASKKPLAMGVSCCRVGRSHWSPRRNRALCVYVEFLAGRDVCRSSTSGNVCRTCC